MNKYTNFIISHKKLVIGIFFISALLCAFLSTKVGVNYNFADYLPDDAASTKALNVMEDEYKQNVPNMRVMINDVSIADALEYKDKIENVEGVEEVIWLDDKFNISAPMEMADDKLINEWYKDKNALYSITLSEDKKAEAVEDIRDIIGSDNAMSGTAVTDVLSPVNTSKDIMKIIIFVIPIVFVLLIFATNSWFESVLFMITIGVAIIINRGTNLMFGTISFVTNAAGSILQLAVSMDYSIFLLHRFGENRDNGMNVEYAMVNAVKQSLSSVLSSGLTTVTGFAALIFMRFKIGPDMGWVMVKAILISLICVLCFLPALSIQTYKLIDKTQHRAFYPDFTKLIKFIMRLRIPALTLLLIIMVPCIFAQNNNKFYYGASEIYKTNAIQMGKDTNAINTKYGQSTPVVVMVPKGSTNKEVALSNEFKKLNYVSSVVSYVNTLDASIPYEILPNNQSEKLYSTNYSRFVLTLNIGEEIDGWDSKIDDIQKISKKYYNDKALIAGDLVSTKDLKTTIMQDNIRVNILAVGFVFIILLINFKSLSLPVILTFIIEASIWINLAIPAFTNTTLHYISYLIISSVQLGATIDYAILLTNRYMVMRKDMSKEKAAFNSIKSCILSIITSASILAVAGIILGIFSTNLVLSQLGTLIGRGAILSFLLVLVILPAVLVVFDKIIQKTSYNVGFYEQK